MGFFLWFAAIVGYALLRVLRGISKAGVWFCYLGIYVLQTSCVLAVALVYFSLRPLRMRLKRAGLTFSGGVERALKVVIRDVLLRARCVLVLSLCGLWHVKNVAIPFTLLYLDLQKIGDRPNRLVNVSAPHILWRYFQNSLIQGAGR